jgi:PleD family two-component response regulator
VKQRRFRAPFPDFRGAKVSGGTAVTHVSARAFRKKTMSILILCDRAPELETLLELAAAAAPGPVRGFAHPGAALDWCDQHVPSLVVVDFLLHACNGIEVIRALRAKPALADTPLLLMLPHGLQTVTAAARKQGASDFLATPVDPTEFDSRVRNLLALATLQLPACAADPHPGYAAPVWRDTADTFAVPACVH